MPNIDKKITITEALIVKMVDSDRKVNGVNVLRVLATAEARVLEANKEVLATGNRDLDGSITETGRRNILHTRRNEEFVEAMLVEATRVFGPLFAV